MDRPTHAALHPPQINLQSIGAVLARHKSKIIVASSSATGTVSPVRHRVFPPIGQILFNPQGVVEFRPARIRKFHARVFMKVSNNLQ
jgi:hypothetical protein